MPMESNNPTQEINFSKSFQQPISEQLVKQKGLLPIPIIGMILLLVIVGVGAYYLGTTKPLKPSATINQNKLDILNDLPIYPDAVFLEKTLGKSGDHPECFEPGNVSPACKYGFTAHTYTTKDSWKKVYEWYRNSSGWKFSGGAGAEGASIETFTKGADEVQVIISGDLAAEGTTKIILNVTNKPQ